MMVRQITILRLLSKDVYLIAQDRLLDGNVQGVDYLQLFVLPFVETVKYLGMKDVIQEHKLAVFQIALAL